VEEEAGEAVDEEVVVALEVEEEAEEEGSKDERGEFILQHKYSNIYAGKRTRRIEKINGATLH